MRRMLLTASILVFVIGIPLFLLSTQTESFFAWTINSSLTAAFLGASYWSSGVLEYLASRERTWANSRIAVPAVLLFTTLTLIVTVLHRDRFHFTSPGLHTRAGTWAWLLVYAVVPVLMGLLLLRQRTVPGSDPPRRAPLPGWMRATLTLQAIVMIPLGLALLVAPLRAASLWPWELTPLTGRAIGAWLTSLGVAAAHTVWENDGTRVRIALRSYLVLSVLQGMALLRYSGEMRWNSASAWIYLLILLSIFVVGLMGELASRQTNQSTVLA
jgi:hypothetical protein